MALRELLLFETWAITSEISRDTRENKAEVLGKGKYRQ